MGATHNAVPEVKSPHESTDPASYRQKKVNSIVNAAPVIERYDEVPTRFQDTMHFRQRFPRARHPWHDSQRKHQIQGLVAESKRLNVSQVDQYAVLKPRLTAPLG